MEKVYKIKILKTNCNALLSKIFRSELSTAAKLLLYTACLCSEQQTALCWLRIKKSLKKLGYREDCQSVFCYIVSLQNLIKKLNDKVKYVSHSLHCLSEVSELISDCKQ
jgi:hypothetical protein